MGINFPVAPGTIVLCDYNTGFVQPEMIKRRPAVVISPRLPHRERLCTVVPLSQTAPRSNVAYQCKVVLERELPHPFPGREFWVKADMLATVSFGRLDLFRTARDQSGRRKYIHPKLPQEDMRRVSICILHALGLSSLTDRIA
jgi:uncharacterized protein YifN (PemK superfamily)